MSLIGDILTTGLATLATAKGESVGYRTGTSGAFTALTGFVLTQDRISEPTYDEGAHGDMQRRTATLKGPVTPVLAKGYQIQDAVTGLVWAVETPGKIDVQQVVLLWREEVAGHGPNRGGQA